MTKTFLAPTFSDLGIIVAGSAPRAALLKG
jgi:hypothetical protein